MCLIANSDGFMLAGFLNYYSDFISIMFSFLNPVFAFDESNSFGEQSNVKKSDIPHAITVFPYVFQSNPFYASIPP